jgi:opacity protein-like surface antigen
MSRKFVLGSLGIILLAISAGFAQDQRSEVSVQGMATVTNSTNSLISPYSATKSGGFLAGYRYHLLPWFAIEGDYGYTRNTQNFFDPLTFGAGVQTNIHELTGEAVLSASNHHRIRPYVLAGMGGLFFRPTNSPSNLLLGIGNSLGVSSSQSRMAFVYGGGLDFNITRSLALRGEYRGLVFRAPGFDIPGLSGVGLGSLSNLINPGFTHMAQPSVGLVFRF